MTDAKNSNETTSGSAQLTPVNIIATSPPRNFNLARSPPNAPRAAPRVPDDTARETSSPPPNYIVNYSVNFDDLEFHEHLGSGRFGSVSRALLRSRNIVVAVKKVEELGSEVSILSQLSHRNIVRFYGVYSHAVQLPTGRQLQFGIITEYCDNGSLYDLLKRIRPQILEENSNNRNESSALSFANILQWAADIARGMNYLHSEAPIPIIHRDLKSTNVLLSRDWMCKICDFGSSRTRNRDNSIISVAGTPAWMAPELVRGEATFSNGGCDIWSFGVVLWELLTCEQPFKGLDPLQIMYVVGSRSEHPPIPNSCPHSFHDLLKRCWAKESTARPAFAEIIVELAKMLSNDELPSELSEFTSNTARKLWLMEVDAELQRVKLLEQGLEVREHAIEERERQLREQKKKLEVQLLRMSSSSSQSHLYPSSSLNKLDVLNWSENEVARWVLTLGPCGLSRYSSLFEANHISGRRLMLLSKNDFHAMGITSLGHQQQFIEEINFLRIASEMVVEFPPLQITSQPSITAVPATPVNGDPVFQLGSEDGDSSSLSNPGTPVPTNPASLASSTPVSRQDSTVANAIPPAHTPLSVTVSNSNSRIYLENREFFVNLAVGMYSFPATITESGQVKDSLEYRVFVDGHVSFDPLTVSSPDDAIALTDLDLTVDIANVFSAVFVTFDPGLPTEQRICAATGSHGSGTSLVPSSGPYVAKETASARLQRPFTSIEVEITLRQPYCCCNRPFSTSVSGTFRDRLSSHASSRSTRSSELLVARATAPPTAANDDEATLPSQSSFEYTGVIRKQLAANFDGTIVKWSVNVTQLTSHGVEEAVNSLTSPLDDSVISVGSTSTTRNGKGVVVKAPQSPRHLSLASITSPSGDDPVQFYWDARRNSISQITSPNEVRPSSPAAVLIGQQVKNVASEQSRLPYGIFSPVSSVSLIPPVKTYASVAASAKPQLTTPQQVTSAYQITHQNTYRGHHSNHHHQSSASPFFRHAIRNNQQRRISGGSASSGGSGSGSKQLGKSGGAGCRYNSSGNK